MPNKITAENAPPAAGSATGPITLCASKRSRSHQSRKAPRGLICASNCCRSRDACTRKAVPKADAEFRLGKAPSTRLSVSPLAFLRLAFPRRVFKIIATPTNPRPRGAVSRCLNAFPGDLPHGPPTGRIRRRRLVQLRSQALPERFPAPQNLRLHRPQRNLEDVGHLLITQSLDLAQHQSYAKRWVDLFERSFDKRFCSRVQSQVERSPSGVLQPIAVALRLAGRRLQRNLLPLMASEPPPLIAGFVDRNPVDPRS